MYAGLLEDNAVKYVAVSEGQEFLLGKKLEKGGEGDGDGEEKKVAMKLINHFPLSLTVSYSLSQVRFIYVCRFPSHSSCLSKKKRKKKKR